jgi:hypothetical protein
MGMKALPFLGFYFIAALTWFFSTRPRLFIRVFVPSDQFFPVARTILRNDRWCFGLRLMSGLQFLVAVILTLAGA